MKVAIVWANPYNKNMGVAALSYSSLALIYDVASKDNDIEVEITFVGSSQDKKDSLLIGNNKIPFDNIYGMNFFYWKSIIKLVFFPRKFQTKKILNLDFIFDIGDGDSFSDIYGNARFKAILNSKIFFNLLNKPQVLLPQTIGPFNDPLNEKRAFQVMKKLKLIISRDKKSYDYTAKYLNTANIEESIDVAFYLPYRKRQFDEKKINVGINISGLLWHGGYTQNNQFGLKANFRNLMIQIFDFFQKQKNIQIHIISHVVPLNVCVEDDFSVGEEFMNKYPEVILAERFANPIEAKSYISGMDFFIGSRMHACIGAFSSNVPVFPLAYSRKFNGLFVDTLKYEWIGDCINENESDILERLDKAFTQRELLKKEIEDLNLSIVKPRIDALKKIIREVISS